MGTFHVIGKAVYVETPNNTSYYGTNYYLANQEILQQKVAPIVNFSNYDNWTYNSNYNFTNSADGTVDLVVVVWRGLLFANWWSGISDLGGSSSYTLGSPAKTIKTYTGMGSGSGVTVQSWGARDESFMFHAMVHEISHWLLGYAHPYNDSGVDDHGFWGMLRHSKDGICANAYEREALGWITPTVITGEISDAALTDYVTTGVAYKYHPSNGATNEYYYFENHQQLSVYDNATVNTADKGIFVLHQQDVYNGTNNMRCRTSSGDYTWSNPFSTTSCYSQTLPAFKITSPNRYGLDIRDFQLNSSGNYEAIFALADANNYITCAGYEYGEGAVGTFNTTGTRVFSPWTNPSTHTWGNSETNLEMAVTSQSGNTVHAHFYLGSMTLTESTTLTAGTYNITGNLTVASGTTLNVPAGTTLNFSNGAQFLVNGILNATGTSSSPIVFNFTTPNSTTQNGIVFNSGSSVTFNYCRVLNAYNGIYENSATVNITNSAISNCTNGIYLYSSNPVIQACNIHDNSVGIYLATNSSPYFYNNYIQNNTSSGVNCYSSSNPKFGNGNTPGNNNITGNAYGVICQGTSIPMIGKNSTLDGGYNNLVNTTGNVLITSSNTIYAQNTWWGTTVPNNFKITGTVSYSPYLSSAVSIATPPLSKTSGNLVASDNNSIPMLSELDKAYQFIASNNKTEARNVCLNLVNNYPDYSVSFNALNLLKEIYLTNNVDSIRDVDSLKNIYQSLFNSENKKKLYAVAGLLLADVDKENKLQHIDDVINSYGKDSVVEMALSEKFIYYYFDKNDKQNALAVSKRLDNSFPLSLGAIGAHQILGDTAYYNVELYKGQAQSQNTVQQTPTEFGLSENYPNPFNPVTTIEYQIPKNGFVTLKVYDILGRVVKALVDQNQAVGKYSVSFDASKLASGVYIYQLKVNSGGNNKFTATKKMQLIK